MIYPAPGQADAPVQFKARYDNFIGGQWTPPVKGQYFDNVTPITGQVYTQAARSTAEDVELALDAAHAAAAGWGSSSAQERAGILLKIADRIDAHLDKLAYAETVDNGKPIRETLNADVPLAADHFRYFAGAVRTQEGAISQIDATTVAYHFHEPLGVVGQIIPWNFPLLMAAWKLAPALAAGNCIVLKPAEQTPTSILVFMELIADLLPPGVLNIVNGFGREAGMPLASSKRIAKIAFTGSTSTGRVIAQAAANSLIPATLELGGKSPNIFFPSSRAEHSMPKLCTPRSLPTLILNGLPSSPGGSSAPTVAQGIRMPGRALGAPQTICSSSPVPASTLHTRRRSASGCCSASLISATTMDVKGGATGRNSSTSRPAMVRVSASCSVLRDGLQN